jgi:hypothetical protein
VSAFSLVTHSSRTLGVAAWYPRDGESRFKVGVRTVPQSSGTTLSPEERRQSNDYRRNGTATLFAALTVGTGEVTC